MSGLSSTVSSSGRMCAAIVVTTVMIGCAAEPEGKQAMPEPEGLASSSSELRTKRHSPDRRHCRARCNDHNPCTVDACVEGVCSFSGALWDVGHEGAQSLR